MKKIEYIAPAMQVTQLYLHDGIMQTSGSNVNGNGTNNFNDSEDGEEGDEGDAKRSFNIWSDDWSR